MKLFQLWLLSLVLVFPRFLAAGQQGAPDGFKTMDELRSFVDKSKGFGIPQTVDFDLSGVRIYVALNSPGSGSPATRSYAYYWSEISGEWKLIDTHWFDQEGIPSYVYLDTNKDQLIFVSYQGRVIRRLKLKDYDLK